MGIQFCHEISTEYTTSIVTINKLNLQLIKQYNKFATNQV